MRTPNLTVGGRAFNRAMRFAPWGGGPIRGARGLVATAAAAAGLAACAPGPQECVRVVSWADYRELALEQEVVDSLRARHPEIPVCLESLEGSGIYRERS